MKRCPHCTAPIELNNQDHEKLCPRCRAQLFVERDSRGSFQLSASTPGETFKTLFDLKNLSPLLIRQVDDADLGEVRPVNCPACGHSLRLSNLGSARRERGGIMVRFPTRDPVSLKCLYCNMESEWNVVSSELTVDHFIPPPSKSSMDVELDTFLKEKPTRDEGSSGGCFSLILLSIAIATLLTLWNL